MKLTTACSLAILSSAAAFSPNSMLSKSAVFANSATTASTSLSRPMVASQEVEVNNVVNNGQRKKTKEERLQLASKELTVHVIGLSIHHASVEVREKLAVPEAEWNAAAQEICSTGAVSEAAVLSTCNRFEVYYAAPSAREAVARVTEYLAKRADMPVSQLRKNVFMLDGEDAVWHLMRVSGGLDSLVVGEGQILSQVRQCHLHSIEEDGHGGKVLSRMLNTAVAAGKRVRSETAISKGSVSISSAAVELSEMMSQKDLNLPFSEARLSVIGAGKMTRLLITHLASRGLEKITIVNRSMQRPQELAEQFPDVDIEIKLMDELWNVVGRSDIVYTAAFSDGYIVDAEKLRENGLAGGRPMMMVDIGVPRNVGPDCNEIDNTVAYNVDDLKAVVAKNTAMRQKEMIEAETLLNEEKDAFCNWRESLAAIPTINQLQEKANIVREEELNKCTRKLSQNGNLSDKEMEAVERLSRGIVNKLLHGPMSHLRSSENSSDQQNAIKELSAMFQLQEDGDKRRGGKRGRSRRK